MTEIKHILTTKAYISMGIKLFFTLLPIVLILGGCTSDYHSPQKCPIVFDAFLKDSMYECKYDEPSYIKRVAVDTGRYDKMEIYYYRQNEGYFFWYNNNGKIVTKGRLFDSRLDGWVHYYSRNGIIQESKLWRNGEFSGNSVNYKDDKIITEYFQDTIRSYGSIINHPDHIAQNSTSIVLFSNAKEVFLAILFSPEKDTFFALGEKYPNYFQSPKQAMEYLRPSRADSNYNNWLSSEKALHFLSRWWDIGKKNQDKVPTFYTSPK